MIVGGHSNIKESTTVGGVLLQHLGRAGPQGKGGGGSDVAVHGSLTQGWNFGTKHGARIKSQAIHPLKPTLHFTTGKQYESEHQGILYDQDAM